MSVTSENGSVNPTLVYLKEKIESSKRRTIVAADSSGDYVLLSEAITAGKTDILIKNGLYIETADITLTTQKIEGESRTKTIIEMRDSVINFTASDIVSTGTITLTNNSATVTGIGTSFLTIVDTDNLYLVTDDRMILKVLQINSNTELILEEVYRGTTISGKSHDLIHTNSHGSTIKNVTINHTNVTTSKNLITIAGINNRILNCTMNGNYTDAANLTNRIINTTATGMILYQVIEDVDMETGLGGILLKAGINCRINNVNISSMQGDAISTQSSSAIKIRGGNISGIGVVTSDDMSIRMASSSNISISETSFNYCESSTGIIGIGGTTTGVKVISCSFENCNTSGSKGIIDIVGTNSIIKGCAFKGITTGYAINSDKYSTIEGNIIILSGATTTVGIIANQEGTIVNGNFLKECGIQIGGTEGIISNNVIIDAPVSGIIIIETTSTEIIVNGNKINNPAGNGISVLGDKCTISGNNIRLAAFTGISINGAADRTCVTGNISLDCTVANYTDSGTNTSNTGNIFV